MNYQRTNRDKYRQRKSSDPGEWDRLLMQYGGIFKHNIEEFAKNIKKIKPTKNLSR